MKQKLPRLSSGLRRLMTTFCLLAILAPLAFNYGAQFRHGGSYRHAFQISSEEQSRLADMRDAGLRGDRSQIPAMITALRTPQQFYQGVALHALERLGATEALPDIDNLIANSKDEFIVGRAKAARARLLSEAEANKVEISQSIYGENMMQRPTLQATKVAAMRREQVTEQAEQERSKRRVRRFLEESGVNVNALGGIALAFHKSIRLSEGRPPEAEAMLQIADMVYRGEYRYYKSLPELQNVNFSADPECAMKIRYAQLSKEQRIATMVNELAQAKVVGTIENHLMQLLTDEGKPAAEAVAAKLLDMDAHREQYVVRQYNRNFYPGFCALFRVLNSIGDKTQAPVVARFLKDKELDLSYFSEQVYYDVRAGRRVQWAAGD